MKKVRFIMILLLIVCGLSGCAKMDIKNESFVLELGDNPNQYKESFVELKNAELSQVVFDFSDVDCYKSGTYTAKATLGKSTKEFSIVIRDTVAPKIRYHEQVSIEEGETLSVGNIITDVIEKSGRIKIRIKGKDDLSSVDKITIGNISFDDTQLTYAEAGEYDETLIVTDDSGNRNDYKLHIIVKEKKEPVQEKVYIEKPKIQKNVATKVIENWVSKLSVAQQTNQLIIVAVRGCSATVSMHTRDQSGNWQQNLSTTGYVGGQGVGQASEYASYSPRGVWGLGIAFGNQPDPGITIGYTQVDDTYYWIDDVNSAYYNRFVSTRDVIPDWSSAEHIQSCGGAYNYVLSINYNTECIPGKGSAFFLHCSTGKPTAGCVSVPESEMIQILKLFQPGCLIVIDQEDAIYGY